MCEDDSRGAKFMIGVDCDGVACAVGQPGRALSTSCDMAFAAGQATREADAAARALFDAGAGRVVVWDNHGSGCNLLFDRLDPRCEVALGAGFGRRWPGLDEGFAGVLMIGYHAMEGTPDAVLAHTYSPGAYRWIKVNGREVGEIALDAAVAGELGVPVLFVSSDQRGCDEALEFLPGVETVATKQGRGARCAFSMHPARACEEIYAAVRRAAERAGEIDPFTFETPGVMEIRFKRLHQAAKARIGRRGWHLAGAYTLRRRFDNLADWAG